jgi:hypothetical protein
MADEVVYPEGNMSDELEALLDLKGTLAEAECNAVLCNTRSDHEKVQELRERLEEWQSTFLERWDY